MNLPGVKGVARQKSPSTRSAASAKAASANAAPQRPVPKRAPAKDPCQVCALLLRRPAWPSTPQGRIDLAVAWAGLSRGLDGNRCSAAHVARSPTVVRLHSYPHCP